MTLKVVVESNNNAAWAYDRQSEMVRVLRAAADRLESGDYDESFVLFDVNGNSCGSVVDVEDE